jgi:hypothetical protein
MQLPARDAEHTGKGEQPKAVDLECLTAATSDTLFLINGQNGVRAGEGGREAASRRGFNPNKTRARKTCPFVKEETL